MKSHEIVAVTVGIVGVLLMFVTPALMSAWDNWKERHDHK